MIATMANVPALPTEYIGGKLRLPRGDVSLIFGDGGNGKGMLIMSAVKQVTSEGGTVVLVLPEDHPCETVKPRLIAAGLTDEEMSRVVNLTRLPNGGRFKLSADLTHDGDLPLLREEILPRLAGEGHDVKMVVLDPLSAVVGYGSIQSNSGARRAIEPFQDLCQDTGICGVVVAHTTKAGVLQGSAGLIQAVRTCLRVSLDRSDPRIRVVSAEKTNNTGAIEDVRFTIESDGRNAKCVFLTAEEIDRRNGCWRRGFQAIYRVKPDDGEATIMRFRTRFSDMDSGKRACEQKAERKLTWKDDPKAMESFSIFKKNGVLFSFLVDVAK